MESNQPVDTDPADVVAQWLDAVSTVDGTRLQALVEPVGLVVVAGVENQLRSDEFAALLDTGMTEELSERYWRSFRDDFESIRGLAIDDVAVEGPLPESLGPDHVAVRISSAEQDSYVVLRRSGSAGWQLDMVATLGPGMVVPLREYLESAVKGAYAEAIGDAFRSVVPSLDAAARLDPDNALLVFETEFIRQEVGG